jgi:hypothetical protein
MLLPGNYNYLSYTGILHTWTLMPLRCGIRRPDQGARNDDKTWTTSGLTPRASCGTRVWALRYRYDYLLSKHRVNGMWRNGFMCAYIGLSNLALALRIT